MPSLGSFRSSCSQRTGESGLDLGLTLSGLDNRAETMLINCELVLIISSVIYLAEDKQEFLPVLAILISL